MISRVCHTILLLLITGCLFAQAEKKRVDAVSVLIPPKIDGVLDEAAWTNARPATDFVQVIPYNGKPSAFRTEVRFLYDNSGLYIGAMMFDPNPDSIPRQIGLRDASSLNADYFSVQISPFNDGINAFDFLVWVSDVQTDYKQPNTGEDMSWDAVWVSKARIQKNGWVVEMKIPYSAIRFPKTAIQEWGINCSRDIRRYRENSSWNFIDSKISGTVNQEGMLEGIRDITPPLRLSISPYVSGYMENNPDNPDWQFSYNYGADLKYGITQSFTLDMTLIPDFGQVPSDDKIYNFSPFEIRYDERRQFFTEGTELFNKGGIFYSRRVGAQPRGYEAVYDNLGENERVTENPMQTKLINASKISGRTNKGLGIGFFNALSANTWAEVQDTVTGVSRKVLTQGFTNYNMIVFDQALKNNSYFDLLNTNYYIPTEGYTANVSGTDFKFANKAFTYALTGNMFVSQKYYSHNNPDFGLHYDLSYGKISGNFQFNYNQVLETDQYDPNDMGFNERNNKFNNSVTFEYNIYEPFWKVNDWYNTLYISYNCLYNDLKYTSLEFVAESNTTTRKYLTLGSTIDAIPVPYHDYYEPRVPGYMYIQPAEYNIEAFISPDYRKKFIADVGASYYLASRNSSWGYEVRLEPRYRVTDRLTLNYELNYQDIRNNVGYVMDSLDPENVPVIIFGKRDIRTITNIFHANFMFTSRMSIDFRLRHYWVTAPYSEYYTLNNDGTLSQSSYHVNQDLNYNLFNIDMTYVWNFAPGSQLSVVWKNAINTVTNAITKDFFGNLHTTIESPASNSFSIRLLYYLDALYFTKKQKNN
jgi:hypothetical protein